MMRIVLAKAADSREQAKIVVKMGPSEPKHTLKLHRSDKNVWFPELDINLHLCEDSDIFQVRTNLIRSLYEVITVLESDEMADVKMIASALI